MISAKLYSIKGKIEIFKLFCRVEHKNFKLYNFIKVKCWQLFISLMASLVLIKLLVTFSSIYLVEECENYTELYR